MRTLVRIHSGLRGTPKPVCQRHGLNIPRICNMTWHKWKKLKLLVEVKLQVNIVDTMTNNFTFEVSNVTCASIMIWVKVWYSPTCITNAVLTTFKSALRGKNLSRKSKLRSKFPRPHGHVLFYLVQTRHSPFSIFYCFLYDIALA
jgi:hypothetical protein